MAPRCLTSLNQRKPTISLILSIFFSFNLQKLSQDPKLLNELLWLISSLLLFWLVSWISCVCNCCQKLSIAYYSNEYLHFYCFDPNISEKDSDFTSIWHEQLSIFNESLKRELRDKFKIWIRMPLRKAWNHRTLCFTILTVSLPSLSLSLPPPFHLQLLFLFLFLALFPPCKHSFSLFPFYPQCDAPGATKADLKHTCPITPLLRLSD